MGASGGRLTRSARALRCASFLLASTSLAGCPSWRGAVHPVPTPEAAVLAVVRAEWAAASLPFTPTCTAELGRLGYLEADDAAMRRLVGYCAAGSTSCAGTSLDDRLAAGCYLGSCTGGTVLWDDDPFPISLFTASRVTLVVSSHLAEAERPNALAHEYAHALGMCALSDGWTHNDQRVWGLGGVLDRVRARLAEQ